MNLNYILGESRSGKSRWIYNQIKKDLSNKDRNLILIVPEQITYEKERELIDFLEVNGIMKVQILSFTRLEYKVLEEVGGIKEKEIDDYGKIMLLREIFEKNKKDLKVFGRSYKKEGFLKNFNGLIKEFKENGLQLNVLEKIKSDDDHYAFDRKLNDIKIIYKNLEEKLEHTYLDNEDKKLLFIRKIKDSNYIKNSYIYIDEFNKFSKLQIKLIRELFETSQNMFITLPVEDEEGLEREEFKISVDTLNYLNKEVENLNPTINYQYLKRENILKDDINHLERNFFSYFPDKYKKNPENIEVFYGQNPYEEVEMVADRIIKDLKNYNIRFRDIGILLGDEAVYLPVIEKVFKEYDIPFFSDFKKDLMDNSFIILLMSYLDCITYNYKREDVFRLLKIGYWDLDYEEIEDLENYCIRWGIDRNRWFSEFNKEDEYSNLDYLNEIRKKVISIIPSKDSFNKEDTIENFVLKIIKEIEKLKLKEKIQKDTERFREEKLYEAAYINNQVWNSVMDLFDQIITISGGSKIKINELKNIIESGLLEYEVGVLPTKLDSITVGNLERTKFGSKSSLYLVGVNDGYIPKTYEDNRILKINGRIDRVDILNFNNNNYVNIIDYKSKDQSIDITALANGMELQLFIYLNALIDNSEEITGKPSDIGGVFYFSILLPWIDGDKHKDKDSIEKELLKEYKMEGYFLEDKELIKKLDKKIEEERESTVAKIKINKNGSISKSSQTLTREAYKGLLKYVNDKVLEIGKEIISGKILIEPFSISDTNFLNRSLFSL